MTLVSTWRERELPVLEAVYAAEERGERPGPEELAEATGLALDVVVRTVGPLVDSRHLTGIDTTSMSDMFPVTSHCACLSAVAEQSGNGHQAQAMPSSRLSTI